MPNGSNLNTEQAAGLYAKHAATYNRLGVTPIFESSLGIFMLIPTELRGLALADGLRKLAKGFMKKAKAIEDEARSAGEIEDTDDAADLV